MKKLCVQGLTLKYTILGTEVSGVETISTIPSTNTTIDNKGVYAGTFTVSLSGASFSGFTQVDPAVFNIQPSAQYCSIDDDYCLLEGDNATASAVPFVNEESGTTTTYDIKCEVSKAGQSNVEGE